MAPKKFDWWLTGFCAARVFNGLVFMTYAAALPLLQKEWRMSGTQAGSIAGGFQIGYALSLIVFSTLADRISARTVYLYSLFASGISALAFAFLARDFLTGFLFHTFLGLSLGGTYTTGIMILAAHYQTKKRGLAVGAFIASTSCGYALSLVISGFSLPWGGYPLSFFLTCLGPILGWVVARITLYRTVVTAPERQVGQRFTKEVLGNRKAMLLIWGYVFHNWELQGMWVWTPAFLTACLSAAGASALSAVGSGANIVALFHLMGLAASLSMGILSDRFGRSQVMLIIAMVGAGCSFAFGWTLGLPLIVITAIGLVYAFSSLGDSPILSAALTEEMEPSYLGAALGLRSLLGFGGAAIAPLVFGAVLDWSNPLLNGQRQYLSWGWAFSLLGLGGLGAVWTIGRYRLSKNHVKN
ncbi:MAG: MFS transporter [Thermodesulfobacteriota bacterium]